MTELVSQQVLIVLHVRREPERPEYPAARHDQVPDTPGDENVNQIVVKGPSRFVAIRNGPLDYARGLVDDDRRNGNRGTAFVACR